MLAEDVQALDGAGQLDSSRDRLLLGLLHGVGGGHVNASVLALGRGAAGLGRLGLGLAGGVREGLALNDLVVFLLLGVALVGLGGGGLHDLADGLQDVIGGHVADLLASLLARLALLGHDVHGLLDQGGDVAGVDLGSRLLLGGIAVCLGLGLLLQGFLDTGLDLLGELVGLHLHGLAVGVGLHSAFPPCVKE